MKLSKMIRLTPAAVLLSMAPLGASFIVIDENFTTNTTADWSFAGDAAHPDVTGGTKGYVAEGTTIGGFSGHNGNMRWQPQHTGTSTIQAGLLWQESGTTANVSNYTFSTTGIHVNRGHAVQAYLAIQFEENDTIHWAVSDQSIRTSTGTSTPVPGSWELSTLTFSALDFTDLAAGSGGSLNSTTVLENATGIGVYGVFTQNQSWAGPDGSVQIDSFTVIPEPRTYALIFGLMAIGFILWRRRRQ